MMVSKMNHLFQGLLFRFHVKFQGCNHLPTSWDIQVRGVFFCCQYLGVGGGVPKQPNQLSIFQPMKNLRIQVRNVTFPDEDLDLTDLGGVLEWVQPIDMSQVQDGRVI